MNKDTDIQQPIDAWAREAVEIESPAKPFKPDYLQSQDDPRFNVNRNKRHLKKHGKLLPEVRYYGCLI